MLYYFMDTAGRERQHAWCVVVRLHVCVTRATYTLRAAKSVCFLGRLRLSAFGLRVLATGTCMLLPTSNSLSLPAPRRCRLMYDNDGSVEVCPRTCVMNAFSPITPGSCIWHKNGEKGCAWGSRGSGNPYEGAAADICCTAVIAAAC